jgi:hypothetical protein
VINLFSALPAEFKLDVQSHREMDHWNLDVHFKLEAPSLLNKSLSGKLGAEVGCLLRFRIIKPDWVCTMSPG